MSKVLSEAPAGASATLPQVVVPAGYKLVREDPDGDMRKMRQEYREKLLAESARSPAERTQIAVDERFPSMPGMKRWRVILNDKNRQPELQIWARSGPEAIAAFQDICGILSVEEPADKYSVTEVKG